MLPPHIVNGIRFTCTDCGACCTGAPGVVALTEEEARSLARLLGLAVDELVEQYLDPYAKGYRIRETRSGDCVFFNGRCSVYQARPTQCRTYPFWFKNLRSGTAWKRTCAACPGIGDGQWHGEDDIHARVQEDIAWREEMGDP